MQIAQCIFTGAQDQPSLEFISMCILNLPPIRWSPKSFNHLKVKLQFMVWAPGASGSTWAPWSFLLCDVTICANSHNNCGLCRKFMFFGKNGNCHWMFLLFCCCRFWMVGVWDGQEGPGAFSFWTFSLDPFLQKGSSLQVENLFVCLSVCLSSL